MADGGYSGREVADLVGITYRQLDYWARTDLVRPSLAEANGYGSRRRYSSHDVVVLRLIKDLLDAGLRLEKIRAAADLLRHSELVAGSFIVITGDGRVQLATGTRNLVELLMRTDGVVTIRSVTSRTAA